MNDIQQHLVNKLSKAGEDYRDSTWHLAAELTDAVMVAVAAGLTRDEIATDLAAGLRNGGLLP